MGILLYNKTMTKEKYQKKRKRDIWLVVIFAILIAVFIVATAVTFSFQNSERVGITFLGILFFILVVISIAFTGFFGSRLNQDNEKLSLIKSGVPEEDVEKKYKEIQEARQNGQDIEIEHKKGDKKQKVTTLDSLKKTRKILKILTTIFGILTGVTLFLFYAMLPSDEEEEVSNVAAAVGTVSFLLFIVFVVSVSVLGYQLNQTQRKIDLIEKDGIPADDVDEYLSELKEREKYFRERAKQDKKDEKKAKKGNHYSVFDDHDWEHDVFNDPDIRDDDIMDFMDDDY